MRSLMTANAKLVFLCAGIRENYVCILSWSVISPLLLVFPFFFPLRGIKMTSH